VRQDLTAWLLAFCGIQRANTADFGPTGRTVCTFGDAHAASWRILGAAPAFYPDSAARGRAGGTAASSARV
jgi:hypothetical protein